MDATTHGQYPDYWCQSADMIREHAYYSFQQAAATPAESIFIGDHKAPMSTPWQNYPTYIRQTLGHPEGVPTQLSQLAGYASPDGSNFSNLSDASGSYESGFMSDESSQSLRYRRSPVDLITVPAFKTELEFTPPSSQDVSPISSLSFIPPAGVAGVVHPLGSGQVEWQKRLPIERYVSPATNDPDLRTFRMIHNLPTQEPGPMDDCSDTIKVEAPETAIDDTVEELSEASPREDSDSDYNDSNRRPKRSKGTVKNSKPPRNRRRTSSQSTVGGHARIHKRTKSSSSATSLHRRRSPKARKGPAFALMQPKPTRTARGFPCTFHHFGCPLVFPSKNEWKRHVACQHLQLGYYRCDLDSCNPETAASNLMSNKRQVSQILSKRWKSTERQNTGQTVLSAGEVIKVYNDFNRKDLFTQHCRRMHGPSRNPDLCSFVNKRGGCQPTKDDEADFERLLNEIRARCWHVRRRAPERSNCGFCTETFDAYFYTATGAAEQGPEAVAWEQRMEHVGRHYEKDGMEARDEEIDEDLVTWALECGLFYRLDDGRPWLVGADLPSTDARSASVSPDQQSVRRTRRQPSRTVVVQKQEPTVSDHVSVMDDDAEAEDE